MSIDNVVFFVTVLNLLRGLHKLIFKREIAFGKNHIEILTFFLVIWQCRFFGRIDAEKVSRRELNEIKTE